MDIKNLDLNLLPVLDALLRHRSATRAAQELDMSQPSLSAALARLRQHLGDELFVRTGRGLRPTVRASSLAEPVADILERVRDQILPAAAFDPQNARREFHLAHTDVGAYVIWPRIVAAVQSVAPGIRVGLKVLDPALLADELAEGRIDLAIGSFARLPASLFQRRLYDRSFVALVRREHPLAGKSLTIKRFCAAPHIVVRGASGVHTLIDDRLAKDGLRRSDCRELPSYLMIPPLLSLGDYIAVVPGQLADAFMTHGAFCSLKLPFELPASAIRMHWHRRFNDDAGNRWLRDIVVKELTQPLAR